MIHTTGIEMFCSTDILFFIEDILFSFRKRRASTRIVLTQET